MTWLYRGRITGKNGGGGVKETGSTRREEKPIETISKPCCKVWGRFSPKPS